jgi:hypothetical protein
VDQCQQLFRAGAAFGIESIGEQKSSPAAAPTTARSCLRAMPHPRAGVWD